MSHCSQKNYCIFQSSINESGRTVGSLHLGLDLSEGTTIFDTMFGSLVPFAQETPFYSGPLFDFGLDSNRSLTSVSEPLCSFSYLQLY